MIGVSQPMLDEEARWVAKEMENYLLLSVNDLRKKEHNRCQKWSAALSAIESRLAGIREPQRLALQALITRDCYYVLELYLTYLRQAPPQELPVSAPTSASPNDAESVLPFEESLFDLPSA
jgi:hypothetical protein